RPGIDISGLRVRAFSGHYGLNRRRLMRVSGIDHVNISTQDVEASARFYADVLDLDPRIAAGGRMTPEQGRWLFDHEGQAIIHLRKFEADGSSTGPIDHVAL